MNFRTIKKLSDSTINRIAAGEVVERPASVVKELIENSIDAGAKNISIRIETSGKNLISIADDGIGMTKDEVLLAIERHTTSKLDEDDITNIQYFGFRGEALPSIASVSNLSIFSKKLGSSEGYHVKLSGGLVQEITKANIDEGTKIEVRDLFFATPARLKFLKSDRTEQTACLDIIRSIALAYPHISFSFYADGKEIFKVRQAKDNNERFTEIFGVQFLDNAALISLDTGTYKINGYSSIPTYNRATSTEQHLYVNNRYVKDKLLSFAIKIAYQDYLSRDRHPVSVIFIETIPQYVDVNVHPSKTEIRFRESNEIKGLLISAIKDALFKTSHQTSSLLSEMVISSTEQNILREQNVGIKSYSNQPYKSYPAAPITTPKFSSYNHSNQITNFLSHEAPITKTENISEFLVAENSKFRLGAAICQIHNSYIISQTEDGIIITDQHAAHERLVYEDFKKELLQNDLPSQRMIIPVIVDLQNEDLAESLNSKAEYLAKFGLVFQKFGVQSIAVREIPSILGDFDIEKLILDLADNFKDLGENIALQELIEHVTETYACHYSIRAGRSMNINEMNDLLRKMENTPFSGQCNHGRPTYVTLKLTDIEKLFGRR